jgi:hypothetical protein
MDKSTNSEARPGEATSRVWRSLTRPQRQDVATTQDRCPALISPGDGVPLTTFDDNA